LSKAYQYLETREKDVVVHPQYHIMFEGKNMIWQQIGSCDPRFHADDLMEANHWDAVCVAKRELLVKYPYETPGFGLEDWHFNCQTIADGIEHHVVPETVHFLRAKRVGSLLAYANETNRLIRPTKLFDLPKFSEILTKGRLVGKESGGVERPRDIATKYILRRFVRAAGNIAFRAVRILNKGIARIAPIVPRMVKRILKRPGVLRCQPHTVPEWLIDEWKAIHVIEPETFPDEHVIQTMQVYRVPRSRLGKYYLDLVESFGENVSHVLLAPRLEGHEAGLMTLNYAGALANLRIGGDIAVVATEDCVWPGRTRLQGHIRCIEFGRMCSRLSAEEQEKLLCRLLLQMAPPVVHNVDSDLAYRIFVKYGAALKERSGLYVSTVGKDVTDKGQDMSPAFSYLPRCFGHVKAVATGDQRVLDALHTLFSFENRKLFVHDRPIEEARFMEELSRFAGYVLGR
jgi:hypothetical protein